MISIPRGGRFDWRIGLGNTFCLRQRKFVIFFIFLRRLIPPHRMTYAMHFCPNLFENPYNRALGISRMLSFVMDNHLLCLTFFPPHHSRNGRW